LIFFKNFLALLSQGVRQVSSSFLLFSPSLPDVNEKYTQNDHLEKKKKKKSTELT